MVCNYIEERGSQRSIGRKRRIGRERGMGRESLERGMGREREGRGVWGRRGEGEGEGRGRVWEGRGVWGHSPPVCSPASVLLQAWITIACHQHQFGRYLGAHGGWEGSRKTALTWSRYEVSIPSHFCHKHADNTWMGPREPGVSFAIITSTSFLKHSMAFEIL